MTPEAAAVALAAICLVLWLFELVPPFVPTLLLLAGAPLVTGASMSDVLAWMADPVLALFFGGFALGEAASAHGIDRLLVSRSLRASGGRARLLVGIVLLSTAFLSMWMSNVAAAALMIGALRPMLGSTVGRPLLLAAALGANLGGMTTPVGSGPNAIAIAALGGKVTFADWMLLALPLTIGMLGLAWALIVGVHRVDGTLPLGEPATPKPGERPAFVGVVAALTVGAWLSEPLHGVPAAAVALASAAVLFGSRLLTPDRLGRLDWSTLLLIAGGLGVGRLLEEAGVIARLAVALADVPPSLLLPALLALTAAMSAVMSNTAAATLLVPVATAAVPSVPAVAILVALAASFGMPFVVSTPANAMAVGAGARSRDLLVPGLLLMAVGCVLLWLTGPRVLAALGHS